MATGDSPEMRRMQEEAIRRARETRQRAQLTENVAAESSPPKNRASGHRQESQPKPQSRVHAGNDGASGSSVSSVKTSDLPGGTQGTDSPSVGTPGAATTLHNGDASAPILPDAAASGDVPQNLLANLFKDQDHTLILMLLILIGGESENHELMFALLFLLM